MSKNNKGTFVIGTKYGHVTRVTERGQEYYVYYVNGRFVERVAIPKTDKE